MSEGHIAIIPARKGSKSIKDKNLIKFNGETLIRRAVRTAWETGIFRQIIVSTDYERRQLDLDDMESSRSCKIGFLRRPESICRDKTLMLPVVKHVLDNIGSDYRWVWILQPTSPFREKTDFLNIRDRINARGDEIRGIYSLKPAKDSPNRMYSFKDRKFYRTKFANFNNKQELKPMFERSGNFYVSKRRIFTSSTSMEGVFDNKAEGYLMGGVRIQDMLHDGKIKEDSLWERSRAHGCNIDGPEDLALARYYVNRGVVKL